MKGLIRMIKADQYRMRADQCEKEAAMILNPEIKGQLERIAEYWRELAHLRERYLENRSALRPPSPAAGGGRTCPPTGNLRQDDLGQCGAMLD